MSLAGRAWINLGRAQRKLRRLRHREDQASAHERRLRWIGTQVEGRSFADIGGLYGISGDVALFAEAQGAERVTLNDWGDQHHTDFPAKRAAAGSSIRFVQGDLEDPLVAERIGVHDIVFCSGVIYHSPNPVRQLQYLREITGELLYLGTHTVPELPGMRHACVYYPYLDERSRAAFSAAHGRPEGLLGVGTPFDERPMYGYGNFWWAMTPSALRAMLRTARFEVVETVDQPNAPFWTEVVARPDPRDPLLSPIEWPRLCGEARERGEQPPPFADYYESRRARERGGGQPPGE